MEENKNVETTELVVSDVVDNDEGSGIGTVLGVLIGSGLTLAAIAGGKKLKKLWDKRKTNKEQADVVDCEDYKEVDAEEVESKKETKKKN